MSLGSSGGNQFIPHGDREWQVRELTTVKMSEFSPPEAELEPAIAVGCHRHAFPRADFLSNPVQDRICHRWIIVCAWGR